MSTTFLQGYVIIGIVVAGSLMYALWMALAEVRSAKDDARKAQLRKDKAEMDYERLFTDVLGIDYLPPHRFLYLDRAYRRGGIHEARRLAETFILSSEVKHGQAPSGRRGRNSAAKSGARSARATGDAERGIILNGQASSCGRKAKEAKARQGRTLQQVGDRHDY